MADVMAICFMADVVAIVSLLADFFLLQYIATMLLADVVAMWQMLSPLVVVLIN